MKWIKLGPLLVNLDNISTIELRLEENVLILVECGAKESRVLECSTPEQAQSIYDEFCTSFGVANE